MKKIVIPFKTPTINHLYFNWNNRRILTKEARKMKEEIKEIMVNTAFPLFAQEEIPLKVVVEIHENWFTKKGKVARKDVSNREKFLVDSVFEALRIDDKFIFEHIMKKIQSKNEKAVIMIYEIKKR
jgi:Holliday junction resolvase RusA-like endonuclease